MARLRATGGVIWRLGLALALGWALVLGWVVAGAVEAQLGEPGSDAFLFWTVDIDGGVWSGRLDGSAPSLIAEESTLEAVVVDRLGQRLYWAVFLDAGARGRILSSRLDGSDRRVLIDDAPEIEDLEIDLGAGKMYWTEPSAERVRRADLDGSAVEEVVTGLEGLGALEVAPQAGHLYFETRRRILRSNLDGGQRVLIDDQIHHVSDLAVDETGGSLYVAEAVIPENLHRFDLAGGGSEILFDDVRGIELVDAHLYFYRDDRLMRSDPDGSNLEPLTETKRFVLTHFDVDPVNGDLYAIGDRLDLARESFGASDLTPPETLANFLSGGPHGVAVDGERGTVYFVAPFTETVFSTRVDRDELEYVGVDVSPYGNPAGLALDAARGELYWTNFHVSPIGSLAVLKLGEGGDSSLLVDGLDAAHDVELDPIARQLYWTEGADVRFDFTGRIRRLDLGSGAITDVLTGLPSGSEGLAVDPVRGKMYWTHDFDDTISSANLDGSDQAVILTPDRPHDVAVDPESGKIYWTEGLGHSGQPTGKIRRADPDGSNAEDVFTGLSGWIRDLTFVRVRPIFASGFESGDAGSWTRVVSDP